MRAIVGNQGVCLVVCSVLECRILNEILTEMARKHVFVKFIKAVATSVVENFADEHCPSIMLYKGGEIQVSKVPVGHELGGKRMNFQTVEYFLAEQGVVEVEYEEDPRDKLKLMNMIIKKGKDAGRQHEDDVSDEGEDDREYTNNQMTRYRR